MKSENITITPHGQSIFTFLNPFLLPTILYEHRQLIRQLVRREITLRYKGSFFGMSWTLIQPVIMLIVYTFVFSAIFKAKWGVLPNEGKGDFALALFSGMITFGIFSELVNVAPSIILTNTNFVKKVVFPLEILPAVKMFSTLINAVLSLLALFAGFFYLHHFLPWTVLLIPVVWLPVFFFSLGCGYFLSSLGVFIRDISSAVPIITTMLFFLTPIFYPITAVPDKFRMYCQLNPLAVFVEDARKVMLWEMMPDWKVYSIGLFGSIVFCILGFAWFMKSKNAFVDVL